MCSEHRIEDRIFANNNVCGDDPPSEIRRLGTVSTENIQRVTDVIAADTMDCCARAGVKRVVGNRKGLFTRQRQPKMSAHLIRYRYYNITQHMTTQDTRVTDSEL